MNDDRGSGTLLALIGFTAVLCAGLALTAVGQAVLVRQHAALVADLSSLAAVGAAQPCARAGEVAAANGGRLMECVDDGLDVVVRVAVPLPELLASLAGGQREWSASARAGAPESS